MSHSFGEGAAKIYLSPALLRRPTVPIALVRTLYPSQRQSVNRRPVYSDQNIRRCQYTACLCAERGGLNSRLFVLSYHSSHSRIVSPTWPLGIAANSLSVGERIPHCNLFYRLCLRTSSGWTATDARRPSCSPSPSSASSPLLPLLELTDRGPGASIYHYI